MTFKPVALLATTGLVAGSVAALAPSAQAQDQFSNEGILFEVPTIVEFLFVDSNGAYLSTFGVENLETGERTPLIQETPSPDPNDTSAIVYETFAEFEFEENTPYVLYLESFYNGEPVGTVYSNNMLNPNDEQLADLGDGMEGLANGGTTIRWDDTASTLVSQPQQDRDFNDFVVRAGGSVLCPFAEVPPVDSQPQVVPGAPPAAPVQAEPVPGLW